MYRRINDYLKLPLFAKQYKPVLDLAVRTHFSALKWSMTEQDKIVMIIETNLLEMKRLEEIVLLEVYQNMKQNKKKSLGKKTKQAIERPYSLETKVRDTLPDAEVWDILEEYVPGIRNNSQMPLVYGMRLKSIIGKGHYVGATPEQEKEFLNRILALRPKKK
jgi:hypothetical protein